MGLGFVLCTRRNFARTDVLAALAGCQRKHRMVSGKIPSQATIAMLIWALEA
jgi:hypothetical protein